MLSLQVLADAAACGSTTDTATTTTSRASPMKIDFLLDDSSPHVTHSANSSCFPSTPKDIHPTIPTNMHPVTTNSDQQTSSYTSTQITPNHFIIAMPQNPLPIPPIPSLSPNSPKWTILPSQGVSSIHSQAAPPTNLESSLSPSQDAADHARVAPTESERKPGPSPTPKQFFCTHPGCGKVFFRKHHLVSHLVSHTEGKPFKCPRKGCSGTFRRNQDLRRHLRKVKHDNDNLSSTSPDGSADGG